MIKEISEFFKSENIEYFGVLPIEECRLKKEYLLSREDGFSPKSVICLLVPYYTKEGKNISKYAVSRDYHLYMRGLFSRFSEFFSQAYPYNACRCFSDHSPVSELYLAARCGLGVVGENGLLITEKHSSFIFVGEIFTDISAKDLGYVKAEEIKGCIKCGKCKKACPTKCLENYERECLSAITQKKGELSFEEKSLMLDYNTAWGCDICQNVCPYTERAIKNNTIKTPIEFFYEAPIDNLTLKTLDEMSEEEFSMRAYSWRKRETVRRNLLFLEGKSSDGII
jgi:epoxyqueuosine reductase QueG